MRVLVGCDVGGTFTDFYGRDPQTGREIIFKTPSTPQDPADAIVDGLGRMLAAAELASEHLVRLDHGTTVATNALIQRRGGKVALITTRGFKDLLEIGRQKRPHNYDLQADWPRPLVSEELRFELDERVMADGTVLISPTQEDIDVVVDEVLAQEVDACAVCFLFSFLNPSHEQAVRDAFARKAPHLPISLSSDVLPEFREYERLSTTVLNAYLQPTLSRYLGRLESRMTDSFPEAPIGINQSSGGLMSVERARNFPIRTALSGPAAGISGAIDVARSAGLPDVITLDMGGTSADVCLLRNYGFDIGLDHSVADFPIRLPVIDINTVGAGGGSIAWIESDGLLKVGPISAGSVPGPACYGRGGTEPTVSDAQVVLGRLGATDLLAGSMRLDDQASHKAYEKLAATLGMDVLQVADGVIQIVVANMVRAIRVISTERGHDPRSCVLMAFGGAGPLHAVDVARALGITKVLIPEAPGLLCAKGLVVSDMIEEFSRTVRVKAGPDAMQHLWTFVGDLSAKAEDWFAEEAEPENSREIRLVFDMRYVGQNYEIPIEFGPYEHMLEAPPAFDELRGRFMEEHQRKYGFSSEHGQLEVVNLRLRLRSGSNQAGSREKSSVSGGAPMPVHHQEVSFNGAAKVTTPVYRRADLHPGARFRGPAIVAQMDTTTVVPLGDEVVVDGHGNLIINLNSKV